MANSDIPNRISAKQYRELNKKGYIETDGNKLKTGKPSKEFKDYLNKNDINPMKGNEGMQERLMNEKGTNVSKYNIKTSDGRMQVVIPEFPSHLPVTNNKKAPNKYIKINGQSIYNGSVDKFKRAVLMNNMHSFMMPYVTFLDIPSFPIRVDLELHVPINWNTVRRTKGEITWKPPKSNYVINWDVDNFWIYTKSFLDSMVLSGVIPDDNASIINDSGRIQFFPVETFDERKLVFNIYYRKQ